MDTAQVLGLITAAVGAGGFLTVAISGITKWSSGAAGRERVRNTSMKEQRDEAIRARQLSDAGRDSEARKRRVTEEYASQLRRDLTELGVEVLPPWPDTGPD